MHTHRAQFVEQGQRPLGIHHQGGLRDLELHPARRYPVLLEYRAAIGDEARLAQFLQREVDRHEAGVGDLALPGRIVAAHLVQDPRADVEDEARFLGERDELRRCDLAVPRQPPAQQRFGADDEPAREVDLGLVAHDELVAVERPAQLALEQQPLDRRRIHLRGIEDVAVSPGALRVIHGGVGVADQVDDVVGVLRAGGDADAGGDFEFVLADVQRARHLAQQQARERGALLVAVARSVDGLGEDGELVAREPPHYRFTRQDADQALADGLEHAVAGIVAERVVDLLEVVHVHVEQHESAATTQAARDRLVQQVLELHAVRHLGERVEARQVADAAFGALAVRDVAQHEDLALEIGVCAGDRRGSDRDRDRLVARRVHHGLAGPGQHPLEAEGGAVLFRDQGQEFAAGQRFRFEAEQAGRGHVSRPYAPVRRDHQHGVAHAVEQSVQVVARDRRPGERLPHVLERALERRDFRHAARLHGLGMRAAADAVRVHHERGHRAVDPRDEQRGDQGRERGQQQADADDQRHAPVIGLPQDIVEFLLQGGRGRRGGRCLPLLDSRDRPAQLADFVPLGKHGRQRDGRRQQHADREYGQPVAQPEQ